MLPHTLRTMRGTHALLAAALSLAAVPAVGQEACRLCYSDPAAQPGDRPLTIEIWTDLNFAKLALTGRSGGSARLDTAGGKSTAGDIIDLGGTAVTGRGRITGIPSRDVRVDLPRMVAMTTPDGGNAQLVDFTTNLPAYPRLDSSGVLEFEFGARLVIKDGRGGNYRGRIPISVEYN